MIATHEWLWFLLTISVATNILIVKDRGRKVLSLRVWCSQKLVILPNKQNSIIRSVYFVNSPKIDVMS